MSALVRSEFIKVRVHLIFSQFGMSGNFDASPFLQTEYFMDIWDVVHVPYFAFSYVLTPLNLSGCDRVLALFTPKNPCAEQT